MSYYTAEQKRNISRLNDAIARKRGELAALPAKMKGRTPKDIARVARYMEVDIAYLQGYLSQWEDIPSYPVCLYGKRQPTGQWLPAASATVGKPLRSR